MMKRVEVNDPVSIYLIGSWYYHGMVGLQQDNEKAIKLWRQAAELGSRDAHFQLGTIYDDGVGSKKAKFHYEAAAMAGHGDARCNLGKLEFEPGTIERALKHWMIAASSGEYGAMYNLQKVFEKGFGSRDEIDSTLTAYNHSCAGMRSEAREAYIRYKEKEG
jgi:TPR repeat protein